MTKEQEVFEKVNRIRIDFFDSKYKDVHTDDELEEKIVHTFISMEVRYILDKMDGLHQQSLISKMKLIE